jgi:hypothetical protein
MNILESTGFIVIKNFIDPLIAKSLSLKFSNQRNKRHVENNVSLSDTTKFSDRQVPTAYVGSALPMFEKLLLDMTSVMENITEKSLFPTYSYARIYYQNSDLKKHKDRPACEYSASVCLSIDEIEWPLCIIDKNGIEHHVIQNPGDAVIYKGCEQVHWRDMFYGTSHSQVFLHYVDQNGPYSEWKYDKRQSLNINSSKIN